MKPEELSRVLGTELLPSERVKALLLDRVAQYGDPRDGYESLGLAFTAILEDHYQSKMPYPVPGYIAAQMMTAVKLLRSVKPGANRDSYDDLAGYNDIAYLLWSASLSKPTKEEDE